MEQFTLWARVGMSVTVTEADKEALERDGEGFMKRAIEEGRARVDGDTYFPSEVEENVDYEERFEIKLTAD